MTGQELCDILRINYQNVVARRLDNQDKNINYFIDQQLKIERVKTSIQKRLDKENNVGK